MLLHRVLISISAVFRWGAMQAEVGSPTWTRCSDGNVLRAEAAVQYRGIDRQHDESRGLPGASRAQINCQASRRET